MKVALRNPMMIEHSLAWEERQELRHECDDIRPLAMTAGIAAHVSIQRNLIYAQAGRLLDRPCRPYGSELKIRVAARTRHRDAFVACAPIAGDCKVVSDPVVIFEIVSEGSVTTDLVTRNADIGRARRLSAMSRCSRPGRSRHVPPQGRELDL